VILTLAVASGGTVERDQFTSQVAHALKISETAAQACIADMVAAQHLRAASEGTTLTVTHRAQQLHSRTRTAIAEITQMLWDDLPAEDLATAARVLSIITERASAELTPNKPASRLRRQGADAADTCALAAQLANDQSPSHGASTTACAPPTTIDLAEAIDAGAQNGGSRSAQNARICTKLALTS
jgi:hypothetical protein